MFVSLMHLVPAMIPPVWSSLVIMLTLIAIFAGSWIMFWILSSRSTTQRYWVSLTDWGRERGFRRLPIVDGDPPLPLDSISIQRVEIKVLLRGRQTMLVQVQTFSAVGAANPGERVLREGLWNILIREIETPWPPTGLRPTAADSSALDLFSLTSFPLLGASERFVIYGTTSKAAAALTRSSARGLLPPDVGMLLHGRRLVLDFSGRPFDTVEFDRMIAVAEQLVGHLPSPEATE